ncbi:hypothetical protein P8605_00075 [Streptomyces sp. T-3]|nr:hypothetical protein [Streptomyces sp. T-3]
MAALLALGTGCEESTSPPGPDGGNRGPTTGAPTQNAPVTRSYVFYAVYRNELGEHYFDLFEWRTSTSGDVKGTWTPISRDDGGDMTREPRQITGTHVGDAVEFTIDREGDYSTVRGTIEGDRMTLDTDLFAQTTEFKAIDRAAFDVLVEQARASQAAKDPATP